MPADPGTLGDISPAPDDDLALDLRPLTARSVIASALLGTRPPVLPARLLVAAAGLFGVSDSAARSALSRMVTSGEVEPEGDAAYRLGGPLLERQRRQEQSRRAERRLWNGDWILAVIPPGRRSAAERSRQRAELIRARLGELREGVWLRPDNLVGPGPAPPTPAPEPAPGPEHVAAPEPAPGRLSVAPGLEVHSGRFRPDSPPPVQELWDLAGWARVAEGLRTRIGRLTAGLEAGDVELLASGFVVSAAVLRSFQRDPLLPDELLPPHWPGRPLRSEYDRFDVAYRALLRSWFRRQAVPSSG